MDDVVLRLLLASGAERLSDHRHEPDADRKTADPVDVLEDDGHGLCRDGGRPQGRYRGLDRELTELEHTVLDTGRDTDREDTCDHIEIRPDEILPHHDDLLRLPQEDEEDDRRQDTAQQGRERGTGDAPAEAEDKDGVSDDVHDVRNHRDPHRETAVSTGTIKGRTDLIEPEEREGGRGKAEVGFRSGQHRRLHAAEDEAKELTVQGLREERNDDGDRRHR